MIWFRLFIKDETRPSWHIIRPTSRSLHHVHGEQSTVTWTATWFWALVVLFSLSGGVMGRETVYLWYDVLEVLQSWRDRNANESRKRYPSTGYLGPKRSIQDVSLQISVTNCVPLDFCYQLCTPKGVHNFLRPRAPFTNMDWLELQHEYVITSIIKWDEITYPSQNFNGGTVKV